MKQSEDPDEEKMRQLVIINNLAKRLPWIVLIISLTAFVLIFFQALIAT